MIIRVKPMRNINETVKLTDPLQELLSTDPGSRVHAELHVAHLLINLLKDFSDSKKTKLDADNLCSTIRLPP